MSMFYNKYIKYKKKYIELKNKLNTDIFKGGDLIETEFLNSIKSDPRIVNDEFFVSSYHGALLDTEFKIPDNIILILSNCCGATNYANTMGWYDPFNEENSMSNNTNTITKDDFIDKIKDSKINIGRQEYLVLKPGSTICDMSLLNKSHDFAVGQHVKKFGDTHFYDTMMELDNEASFNKNLGYISNILDSDRLDKFREDVLKESNNYIQNSFVYFKKSVDIQILLYMFHNKYSETLFSEYNLDNISNFIKDVTYEEFKLMDKSSENGKFKLFVSILSSEQIHIGEYCNDPDKLTNQDTLLFIFFNILIKKTPVEMLLSTNLEELGKYNTDTVQFVILYACQGGPGQQCAIDECYRLFNGIPSNKKFISTFIDKINSNKISADTNIIKEDPYIYYNNNNITETIDRLRRKSQYHEYYFIESLSDDDLVVFVNLFYDILNNTGDRIDSDFGTQHDLYQIGKLISPKSRMTISADAINKLYGKEHLLNIMIIEILIQDNLSYFRSFMNKFDEFIYILGGDVNLTVEKFHTKFNNDDYILYNELLNKYGYTVKTQFPNDINNIYQLKKLFKYNFFESDDDKTNFCKSYKTNWTANQKDILNNFNIFIKSAYKPDHTILAFNNLDNLVREDKILELKLEYIKHLIGQYDCTDLINEAQVKITPKAQPQAQDNSAW